MPPAKTTSHTTSHTTRPTDAGPRLPTHLAAAIAFGADASLEAIAELFSTFVRAFVPDGGLAVRVTRGKQCEVLPSRFSATAAVKAAQLARGGIVELSAGAYEEPGMKMPLFWIASTPAEDAETRGVVPVRIGVSFPRPRAATGEAALAHAVDVLLEAAADIEGCASALATAETLPLTVTRDANAFEIEAGTSKKRDVAAWLAEHVRAPGPWVLVPGARARDLSRPPPDGLTLRKLASGVLVSIDGGSPFAPDEEALETLAAWLAPVLEADD